MCEKCLELEKEIAKLKRQVNLKNRKIAKLRKNGETLLEEVEELDKELSGKIEVVKWEMADSRCPKCGRELGEIMTAIGFSIMVCDGCNYRAKRS